MEKKKTITATLIIVLLIALCVGVYLNAINHRYKSVGPGVGVLDTWTKTILAPDSTGHYVPYNYESPKFE